MALSAASIRRCWRAMTAVKMSSPTALSNDSPNRLQIALRNTDRGRKASASSTSVATPKSYSGSHRQAPTDGALR
jgi:hypothetical protein